MVVEPDDGYMVTGRSVNASELFVFLNKVLELRSQGLVGKEDKYVILEDMDSKVKGNYLEAVVTFAYLDGVINEREVAELYSLMCQIKTDPEIRMRIRCYTANPVESLHDILTAMDSKVPEASENVLHLSLIKELIRFARLSPAGKTKEQEDFIFAIASSTE